MKYEDALERIQGHGRFNMALLLIFSASAVASLGDITSVIFLNFSPRFWCVDTAVVNASNFSWTEEQCEARVMDSNNSNSWRLLRCRRWRFDDSVMQSSLVTEFELVCGRRALKLVIESLFLLGLTVGYFLGALGDIFGRKTMLVVGCVWEVLVNIALPFVTSVWLVAALRFLSGFTVYKSSQCICVLIEILPSRKRSFYGNNYWVSSALGYIAIPGLAFLVRDWRLLRMLCCAPFLMYWLFWFVPESPRWLSAKGRGPEAARVLTYIARLNGATAVEPYELASLASVPGEQGGQVMDLFSSAVMRKKMLVSTLVQSATFLTYYGLTFNATFVSANVFINVFLQGLIELFMGPSAWLLSMHLPRKTSLKLCFIVASCSLLAAGLCPRSSLSLSLVKAVFAMLSKFTITTAMCTLYVYFPEIYPTRVRNQAVFTISGLSCIVTILAPWINALDSRLSFFSTTTYSLLNLFSILILHRYLPETKNCPLPQSMADGELLQCGNEPNYVQKMMSSFPIVPSS